MPFIEVIPGTLPLAGREVRPDALGLGVIGLHEGRTLLIAAATRCTAVRPVAGCDINPGKREASAGRHYYFNSEVHGMHYGEFANYAQHFAEAILDGNPHSPDLEEGVETFCVMEAVRRSAEAGRPVEVRPLLEEVGVT